MPERINKKQFGQEIKKIRDQHSYSLRQVSYQSKTESESAISPSYWSLIERGERNIPKPDTLKRMAHGLRVPANIVLSLAGYQETTENKIIENLGEITPFDNEETIAIPVVGTIKCGPDGLALSDRTGYEPVQKSEIGDPKDYFWLKTKGDSMIGDGIFDGDSALIRKDVEIENGKIYAVIIDGEEGTLKHVTKKDNSIVLTASNPSYQPRIFVGSDMNEIFIAGRLIQTKRTF